MKWVVLGGVVIAGAIALLVFAAGGDADGAKGAKPGRRAADRPGETAVATTATSGESRTRPRRFSGTTAEADTEPSRQTLESFRSESTDSSWAGSQAQQVSAVAARLVGDAAVTVTEVECRTERCRLVVRSRDPGEFIRVIEAMQSSEGYVGVAKTLMLEGLIREDDGAQEVDVFLIFERSEPAREEEPER